MRAQVGCICRWVRPMTSAVEVVILQHPLEVNNVKGTARLLHLCLPGSRLVVGEQFDAAFATQMTGGARSTFLLYPHLPATSSGSHNVA
ncbi:MAG: DTW domain-containing protein, partial [Pseudomonadota bacterium]|nr:DTW domain-containing protein [Pseudomonadota bacterium]